ncbi:hypothetical protein Fcan01_17475 [Folsomia candida]|uniref:Uncharacterized protein n=1 Tax=Folsomia candida TaxID=158441 RepID=A0A226DSI6_FOLCA|nr:hypothetical protein Fcan01_17475 [Folsomia candida]
MWYLPPLDDTQKESPTKEMKGSPQAGMVILLSAFECPDYEKRPKLGAKVCSKPYRSLKALNKFLTTKWSNLSTDSERAPIEVFRPRPQLCINKFVAQKLLKLQRFNLLTLYLGHLVPWFSPGFCGRMEWACNRDEGYNVECTELPYLATCRESDTNTNTTFFYSMCTNYFHCVYDNVLGLRTCTCVL